MSSQRSEEVSDQLQGPQSSGSPLRAAQPSGLDATVLVRGETVRPAESHSPPSDVPSTNQQKTPQKQVSEVKNRLRGRLPALDDDNDVGSPKEHIVTRDGEADLTFTGTLLASAAPPAAPSGHWREYRVYETTGGKYVFSKAERSVFAEDQDTHEAEVFDPAPSSVPSQLLRGARDLARSRPLTWTDAAAGFFGYDPLAKTLYRKLGGQFDEHVS